MGQLSGDALGSLVEFQSPEQIKAAYPTGVREITDGGTFNTIAGQPTDDSELAILLARSIVTNQGYNSTAVLQEYKYWLQTEPFDCGITISSALRGFLNYESQANGALMRISPLGIFGSNHELEQVAQWSIEDALLTHPHPVCQQVNTLFTMAIAFAINTEVSPVQLYKKIIEWSHKIDLDKKLLEVIYNAEKSPPADYVSSQGWVLIAFQNALWQLLHADNIEEGIVDTISRGGDTDTNAAICGALLGSVYGYNAIPQKWSNSILHCRPEKDNPKVTHPRPECLWPVDVLELTEELLNIEI